MRINPKQKILELDGTPAENSTGILTIGFVLNYIMTLAQNCDALVAFRTCQKCMKDEEFEVTEAHRLIMKEQVTSFAKLERLPTGHLRPFNNLVFGQVMATLEGEDIGIVEKIEPVANTETNVGEPKATV